ncbi:MAG: VWA domain-containing protein [bacterium]
MKKIRKRLVKNLNYLCLAGVIALGFMTIVGTGGGGGGGGNGSAGGGDTTYQEPDPMPSPVTTQQDVDVSLPQGSSLNNETLKVLSFYGTSQIAPKAQRLYKTIPVTITDTDKGQVVILVDSQDNPLFFSYLEASGGTAVISSDGIAKGLIWMNPYVMILPADQKKQFMEKAVDSNLFPQLKDKIDNLLLTDPKNLLDPDNHPEIVKTAFAIVKETFELLGSQQQKIYKDIGISGELRVLDKAGNDIGFENPKMTAYGIEVIDSSDHKTNIFVEGKQGLVTFQWGWPPIVITPPLEEVQNFNNGNYDVKFYKGFNTDIDNWWLPYIPGSPVQFSAYATIVGTATWYNTFITIDIVIDTITGTSIGGHVMDIIGRVVKVADAKHFANLVTALNSGDPIKLLSSIVEFMKDHWDDIAYSIWQDSPGLNTAVFLDKAEMLVKNIAQVLKLVDWANHHTPFLWDLAFAPWKVDYCVDQSNGFLDECSGFVPQIPPTANLSVSPINPYVGDTVTFDASGSTDDRTTYLEYRFDFDGDGNWDTSWSYNSSTTHAYQISGNYNARVEVKDGDGLTARANYYLMVYDISQAVSTAIVIDKSGSMSGGDLDDAKDAAIIYVGYMGSADRSAVISFDNVVTIDQLFTDDVNLLISAIDSIQLGGTTAFYDAVYTAITETKNENPTRRRAIIALTDGYDNWSIYKQDVEVSLAKFQDVVDYAKQEGIPVYTIGLGNTLDESMLQDLATQTNGLYFKAPDSAQLKSIYDTIAGIQ